MSVRTSRPRIQSVASATSDQATIGSAILATVAIASVAKLFGAATRRTIESTIQRLPQGTSDTIKPLSTLRQEHLRLKQQTSPAATLPTVEAAKVIVLSSIAAMPYRIHNQASLQEHLTGLCQATSITEVQRIERRLVDALEDGHQQVFINAMTLACSNAALKVGFGTLQTMPAPRGAVRLIASDPGGRSLVTEITAAQDRECSIETEVVGVSDGSCTGILDAFDQALEEEGVRAEAPQREFTGGICELAAARDFVRSKVTRHAAQVVQPTTSKPDEDTRRNQRLNVTQTGRQHNRT